MCMCANNKHKQHLLLAQQVSNTSSPLQQAPVTAAAAPAPAAAAVIPPSADKSHERSVSNATNLTCGTSPASSATSGFRGDGSQAILLSQHHSGGSGGSPTRRRGSGIGYGSGSIFASAATAVSCVASSNHPTVTASTAMAAASAASTSARLISGGDRRPRRDNTVRAVQFAEEMPALRAVDTSAARGGQTCGGRGGRDDARTRGVDGSTAAVAKPPRHGSAA